MPVDPSHALLWSGAISFSLVVATYLAAGRPAELLWYGLALLASMGIFAGPSLHRFLADRPDACEIWFSTLSNAFIVLACRSIYLRGGSRRAWRGFHLEILVYLLVPLVLVVLPHALEFPGPPSASDLALLERVFDGLARAVVAIFSSMVLIALSEILGNRIEGTSDHRRTMAVRVMIWAIRGYATVQILHAVLPVGLYPDHGSFGGLQRKVYYSAAVLKVLATLSVAALSVALSFAARGVARA